MLGFRGLLCLQLSSKIIDNLDPKKILEAACVFFLVAHFYSVMMDSRSGIREAVLCASTCLQV